MSFLTAWGVNIPIELDSVRATVNYVGQVRDTWMGGVRRHRKGSRNTWTMTLCGVDCEHAEFWRMVFSGQATSIPFATLGDATIANYMTAGTRGPSLKEGQWAVQTVHNQNVIPGFDELVVANVVDQLVFCKQFNTDEYTLIYRNNTVYGAHWGSGTTPAGTLGATAVGNITFDNDDQLTMAPGQGVGDLLWFPMHVPEDIIQGIIDFGNAGNPIAGFAKLPMSGDHFKNEIGYYVPEPGAVKLEPLNGLNELFSVTISFSEYLPK